MNSPHFVSRRSGTCWMCLFVVGVLATSGCAVLQDIQKQWQGAGSKDKMAARYRQPHLDFRSQPGWRKLTYRNPELLAKATATNAAVEISLREQRGILLVDGDIAMDFAVATGKSSHPTPKGSYKIIDKKQDYASNLYGRIVSATGETVVSDADTRSDAVPEGGSFVGARMPYWMRITPTGVGMHVGYVPGRPASHGCIRLKKDVAVELFKILGLGTPVTVESFAPSLGGPVGLDSVVVGEVREPTPRPYAKPKPMPPTAPPPSPSGPSAPTPEAAPAAPAASPIPEPSTSLPPAPEQPALSWAGNRAP